MRDVLVIIPAYQAASTVAEVVGGVRRATGLPVVVIDDGSADDTAWQAESAGATVLKHASNQGKGAALASGFALAARQGAAGVLTMDADGQHAPDDAPRLLEAHRQHPEALVVGIRDFRSMPTRSRIGNAISTWWISRYTHRRHHDSQSGFRLYPRQLFANLTLKSSGFETEAELLLHAAKRGIPLLEVPVQTVYPAKYHTHFHGLHDTWRIIRLVFCSPWWK